MSRIDYSELVIALQSGDDHKANQLLSEVMPRVIEYLCAVMSAEHSDAQECAYQAFSDVLEQIKKGNIKKKEYIFSYLLTTARNEYIRFSKKEKRFTSHPEDEFYQVEPAQQIENLVEEERMQILEECLKELDSDSRRLIRYFLKHPDAPVKEIGKKFGLTYANIRTKKSRLTHRLHHCYKRKSMN